MKCPFCAHLDDKVIDSREGRAGDTIRRRRECLKCSRRFTTYERIDEIPYMVIKKDGRRERFERQKILQGLLKACEKRPVATPKLEGIVDEIESVVHEATERELTTTEIGEMIMHRLKKLDKVAYVRFASVYMDFKDVQEFMSELKNLLKDRGEESSAIYRACSARPDAGGERSNRRESQLFVELNGAVVFRSDRQR